jgi:hypothetical protein
MFLLLYFDNISIAFKNISMINNLKDKFNGEFEIKDLGAAKKVLGWRYIKIKVLTSYTYHI